MASLFNMEDAPPGNIPEGFAYYDSFLTEEEESDLLGVIDGIDLQTFVFQGYTARRKVAGFGYNYNFESRKLSRGTPIPAEFNPLIKKTAGMAGVSPRAFEELLITEYPVGSVINWHRDAPAFGLVAGISLLSDCRFRLKPYRDSRNDRKSVISFPVKRRSLYILKGAARDEWQHSTAAVKEKRYSITLRTLRKF